MSKIQTNPITANHALYDPLEIYRSPLFRTMAGYKFLSGTFLLCGAIAVPALLYTGQSAGYTGAAAIGAASVLPITLQTIFVPHYIARISLIPASSSSSASSLSSSPPGASSSSSASRSSSLVHSRRVTKSRPLIDAVQRESAMRIDHFTLFGYLTSTVERIGDVKACKSWRWVNFKGKSGQRGYYIDKNAAGPVMRRIIKMIERPDEPKSWKVY